MNDDKAMMSEASKELNRPDPKLDAPYASDVKFDHGKFLEELLNPSLEWGWANVPRERVIRKTIADLRCYMSAVAIKNPLEMIDEFEAGYPEYLRQERERDKPIDWRHTILGDWLPEVRPGPGPHLIVALTEPPQERAWCGGPGTCHACDERRGVTVEEALQWKEMTGRKAFLAFGKGSHAHCSDATYEMLKVAFNGRWREAPPLSVNLNGFEIHEAKDVVDGMLVPCNCKERP